MGAALGALLEGALLLGRHPRLLLRFAVPLALVTLLCVSAGVLVGVRYGDDLLAWAWPEPVEASWWWTLLYTLTSALARLVAALVFALVAFGVSQVLVGPLLDGLGARVEAIKLGRSFEAGGALGLLRDLPALVLIESSKLGAYVLCILPTLALGLLWPGPGTALAAVAAFGVSALYLALDLTDTALSRRGLALRRRLRFWRQHWAALLLLGCALAGLLLVPLLNLLVLPLGSAATTLFVMRCGPHATPVR